MQHNGVLPVLAFLAALPLAARAEAPAENVPAGPPLALAAQVDLETALQWTLQNNPNLIATRQNLRSRPRRWPWRSIFPQASTRRFRSPTRLGSSNARPMARSKTWTARSRSLGPSRSSWAIGRPIASRWPGPRIARRDGTSCRPSWRPWFRPIDFIKRHCTAARNWRSPRT